MYKSNILWVTLFGICLAKGGGGGRGGGGGGGGHSGSSGGRYTIFLTEKCRL